MKICSIYLFFLTALLVYHEGATANSPDSLKSSYTTVAETILTNTPSDHTGQEGIDQKKPGIKFIGFINSSYWYDSRQVVGAREELLTLYPANRKPDAQGNDINASPNFNFSAIKSRLTGVITGPKAFGAETSGTLEADFTGVTNNDINGFRLRHAYGVLRWKTGELMFGQSWHPMFVTDVFPQVISLNTGAPFQPFIRNPLISYTHFLNRFSINFTLLSQRDNASDGPLGQIPTYLRNSLMPNAHFQIRYKTSNHLIGAAIDYKTLKPRLITDSALLTNETLGSFALMAYHKYASGRLTIRSKAILGQNLTEHLMLGGYAVRNVDVTTGHETYTPTNHLFFWTFISYGNKVQTNLFGGFAKNFGTSHLNTGKFFGRGSDIAYLYRVAPSVTFISNPIQISTELEYTVAAYGTPDSNGIVRNSEEIGNLRLLLSFFYFF
ncbi:MAG TPA: hypothetical protein VLH16_01980 [Bacteroidales bacterium]|nr:hypothetical protein [Bacteroidales bacterium]